MTSFAPGTSKKEMDRVNKHLYGGKMGGGNAPMGAAANAANAARQQSVAQAAAQKSAFGGMGKGPADVLRQMGAAANAAMGNPKTGIGTTTKPMSGGPRQGGTKQLQFLSDALRGRASGSPMGLGAAMSGPKTGIGTTTKPMPSTGGPKPMSGGPSQVRQTPRAMMKNGGAVKKMASGGSVSSASKRADGIATKGKTRGKMC